jgi:hypothetical protein
VLDEEYKKKLGIQLEIDVDKARVTKTQFLMGSSFKNEKNENIYKYFMRWIGYRENRLIKIFMEDKELMKMMCEMFDFCFEEGEKVLKIKDHEINIEKYIKEKMASSKIINMPMSELKIPNGKLLSIKKKKSMKKKK